MDCIARRPRRVVGRVVEALAERGVAASQARILVYGVTYKPRVRDTRESPALEIIEDLVARGATVSFYDPIVDSVEIGDTLLDSVDAADGDWDLVLVHTVHSEDDAEWLARQPSVLDATYRLPRAAGIETI
jgi:UDP-N-acetyl-D-mannosaminuronate dehydrogenase